MNYRSALILTLALLANPMTVQAAQSQMIKQSRDWTAFMAEEDGNKVCYMVSRPKSERGDYSKRGKTFTIVTHRPAERSFDVISVIAGYEYKPGSTVKVQVGSRTHTLFTHNDTAWARDSRSDRDLADAIRSGAKMVIKGTSSRGTATTDTYGLSGSGDAYEAMSRACGVRR